MEKTLFANLKTILLRYREIYLKGLFLLAASNLLLILNPLLFRQAVMAFDLSVSPNNGTLANMLGPLYRSLIFWFLLLVAIAALSAYLKYLMRLVFISVSREVERDVRAKIFGRIQKQSMAFFDRHGTGELLSRLTNDIAIYREVLGPGIMYPLFSLTVVIPGFIALFIISRPLALISLIPLFVIPLVNVVIGRHIYKTAMRVQANLGKMSDLTQEFFSSIKIIKSYAVEEVTAAFFRKLSGQMRGVNLRLFVTQGSLFPFFVLLTKVITIVLVFFSGIMVANGWRDFSPADFVSFMWIQSYIFFPVLMLGWLVPVYERGKAAYRRLASIYREPVEVRERKALRDKIAPGAPISFRNLSFSYPGSREQALCNVNLEIEGGSFVGITGPIGAGKSTLFKLLNREYEVPDGKILIDGADIHDYPLKAFRSSLVTVEQAPFLFSQSIEENMRIGKWEATEAELEQVASFAALHEAVVEFPEGYQTAVGERGVFLSGGQRQRVALARAFLVNGSILLLDDIFSNVDVSTERKIFRVVRERFRGRTILIISHKISILSRTDKVVCFKDGMIIEEGSPAELLRSGGYYRTIEQLQRSDR